MVNTAFSDWFNNQGKSVRELSRDLSVSRARIYLWLKGAYLSPENADKVSKMYGIPVENLIPIKRIKINEIKKSQSSNIEGVRKKKRLSKKINRAQNKKPQSRKINPVRNFLKHIDIADFKNINWTTLIKEGLNLMSKERTEGQKIYDIIGILSELDEDLSISKHTMHNYLSKGRTKYIPPLKLIPLFMIAFKSDAILRTLMTPFPIQLCSSTDAKVLEFIKSRLADMEFTTQPPEILKIIAKMYQESGDPGADIPGIMK
jgi:transcriptional regulator with XRE-family HTH domain